MFINHNFIDYYKVLRIEKNAKSEIIKKAYRQLALQFHPDVCKLADSNKLFIEIQEAYEILNDFHKRTYYNIIYESYYQNTSTPYSEFERQVRTDFQRWKAEANNYATNLSKESFKIVKEKVLNELGQVIGKSFDFVSTLFAIAVGCTIVGGTFVNLNDYLAGNKESIYGVFICAILSFFLIIGVISTIKKKK